MCLSAFFFLSASVSTIYVSPSGRDLNKGTINFPLRTIGAALRVARQNRGHRVTVEFAPGTYRITTPLKLTSQDTGDLTFRARAGAKVVFSGSQSFRAQWTHTGPNLLVTPVPKGFVADQIFINGDRQTLARYPNEDLNVRIFNGYAKDAISPERVARWKNPRGGFLHAMHSQMWGDYHYRILGKSQEGKLNIEGGWQNNRQMGMHDEYRFVEGIFEELDSPGEWFLDPETHQLYYWPKPGMDLHHSMVEAPQTDTLIDLNGARGTKFEGITFQHASRTFMDNREPLLRSDWTIARKGAITLRNSNGVNFQNCIFKDLGGNAVFVDGKNNHATFRGCQFEQVGANGIAFVGKPDAVRNPLFEYGQRQTYASIDKTPGPKNDHYPTECLVDDCLIHNTGTVEKQSAGVQISMSFRITIRNCTIYNLPRAGINIGDGCWGGHLIEGCDVFDTVLETGDHGSFNSWGRDRYWGLTDLDMTKGERPELAELDTIEPIILRHNRWRCDHGWDIDLDDGSSNYIIENNLCLNGGLKNREGFQRIVRNNIIVNNSFHPHVWFLNSGDEFVHNIVNTSYCPIGMSKPWGREVDENLLHSAGFVGMNHAEVLAEASGRDEHSLVGDALFIDPESGDFRVRFTSVLSLGFKNFSMSDFGVRSKSLRALARHPKFGAQAQSEKMARRANWRGVSLKELIDPADLSAVGLSVGKGVLVEALDPDSELSEYGIQALDVIQSVNSYPIKGISDAKAIRPNEKIFKIRIWRNQHAKDLLRKQKIAP